MIKTFLYGRLTADPQLSEKVQNCCNMSVAADSSTIIEGKPKAEFFRVTVWGKNAERCAKYLHKGDAVAVTGDYSSNEYKDRNGETRYSFNLNNADVQFGAKASRPNAEPAPQSAANVEIDDSELPF